MLIRTHLAITIFAILLLISTLENKLIFVLVALCATFIPDIDSRFSTLGRKKINRILQFFTKHRGITHSFLFLILLTLVLLYFIPVVALGFFLGYGLHLFADSFTKDGVTPFHPIYKGKSRGKIATGGKLEVGIFVGFVIADVALIFSKVFGLF
jgi:membrane-bound metal-dependent hydrolase YbcI (DUF457 family)